MVTDRSADVVTDDEIAEELFVVLRSKVAEEMEAVLASEDPDVAVAATVVTTVMTGTAPTDKLPSEQVTMPVAKEQADPEAAPVSDADTYVSPAGSLSVTTVDAAALGPTFPTVSV